jgi:hypothetical protein
MDKDQTVGMSGANTPHDPSKTATPMQKNNNPGGNPATVTPTAPAKPDEHKKA